MTGNGTGQPLLLLWDIDGTLLQRGAEAHGAALRRAAAEVHGLSRLDGHVQTAGRTDGAIARDLLRSAGVGDAAIDARADAVREATADAYAELCPVDLSARVSPGIAALLDALGEAPGAYRASLVTGNFEPVARLKLARARIGHHFAAGQGAFGSDAESRDVLPALARERAGAWPRERTVVIGDTPHDIACARADRLRVVAVGTGQFSVEALADADAVVDSAAALAPVLAQWATGARSRRPRDRVASACAPGRRRSR